MEKKRKFTALRVNKSVKGRRHSEKLQKREQTSLAVTLCLRAQILKPGIRSWFCQLMVW